MRSLKKSRLSLFAAVSLIVMAFSQPGTAIFQYQAHPYTPNTAPEAGDATEDSGSEGQGGSATSIKWPTDSIDYSQLQDIFKQNPTAQKFNIQFPNQTSWNVTPDFVKTVYNTLQTEAQSLGSSAWGLVTTMHNISFSSANALGRKSDGRQHFPIAKLNGDTSNIKNQVDGLIRQMQYDELNLSNMLPDWMKQMILFVYNAVYTTFNFLGTQLASLIVGAAHR